MKKILALVLMMVLIAPVVFADDTSGATYNSPNGYLDGIEDILNEQECIDHTHSYRKDDAYNRDNEVGIGIDLVVYKNQDKDALLDEVVIQEKYDFGNEENSIYAVARIDLFGFLTKDKD